MPGLFEPFHINKMRIENRFVRSATLDNLGKDRTVSQQQLDFYRELARGEVGLIISSGLFPGLDGWAAPGQVGIHQDSMIGPLKKLTDEVHRCGGKIAAQLMHAGWFGNPELCGFQVVGPSAMVNPAKGLPVRELSSDEVYEHVDQFIQAGRRAAEAGFDAVQIHAAHGWLVSSFLSPVTNRRLDRWGGSAEKRAAFLVQVLEGIRRLAGTDYPVLVKLGLKDYHPQGKSLEEGIASAATFVSAGADAIEVSEGIEAEPFHHIRQNATSPYYIDESRKAAEVIDRPLILVGGIRKLADMEKIVNEGTASAISACRPFIMDQHIVSKLRRGLINGSKCISCNGCITEMHKQNIHCVFNSSLIQE
ncbi:MAG: NADH:flavin oxidoreductase [Dehalococcoidales bacterium]|nr:NADH:flavin oxidoreductase [Dehalococcoidales bacterium]